MNAGLTGRQIGVVSFFFLLAFTSQASPIDLYLPVTGNLRGAVTDPRGTPQMGAVVQLLNKYEKIVSKTLTTHEGRFAFVGLPVDTYAVRVSMASFLPASRDKIAVKAGLDSVLQIHMATLFSNVELSYTLPDAAMTEDWKWVLRSSPATRPITRYVPVSIEESSGADLKPQVFSGTHVMLSMSGGDGGLIDSEAKAGDFGTGFALSTNVLGKNQVQVGGTFGQSGNFGPAALGLCALYTRSDGPGFGSPPEIAFTMTQFGGVGLVSAATLNPTPGNVTAIRAMSMSIYEVADPLDNVHVEYGITGESVDYLQHTSRVSPFARMTVEAGNAGRIIAAYSDGGRPDELSAHQQYEDSQVETNGNDLTETVNTLARMPQLSERHHRLELQRTKNYELGYSKTVGSRTYSMSGFYEAVSNGRINMAGDISGFESGDVLWDGISTTSTYNMGNYRRSGYLGSVNQKVSDGFDVAVAYGRMGGFAPGSGATVPDPDNRQSFLSEKNHNIASAKVRVRVPRSGTRVAASYEWSDPGAVIPRHIFTTQNTYITPGLNVDVRQPLPSFLGIAGHLELTGELRNLLAQGYLPVSSSAGHPLLIVEAPRAIRGGLNFIF